VAVEQRINFTLRDRRPTAHAYDFFRSLFTVAGASSSTKAPGDTLAPVAQARALLQGHQIPTGSVVQQFNYTRSKQLEIWELF
jgi:hypothetical protein